MYQLYPKKTIAIIFALFMVLGTISSMTISSVAAEVTPKQNDTKDTATSLSLNTVYNDNLLSSSDVDWYKFQTSSNGYIQLDFTHDVLTSNSTFWIINIYNSDMDELGNMGVSGTGAKASSSLLGVPGGTYYIQIKAWSYSDAKYGVKVNYTAANNWETETNNKKDTAEVLNVNTQYYGSLGKDGDVDYYRFTISSNGYFQLDFTHDVLTDGNTFWVVTLYNSDMDELTNIHVSGTGAKASTSLLGVPSGTYFMEIEKYHYSEVKYGVKVNYTAANNWETEMNNKKDTADVLNVNTQYYGSLGKDGDVDYYKFALSSNGYVQLDFTHDVLTNVNTIWVVTLYNSDMDELTNIGVSGTGEKASSSLIGVPSGTYFMQIKKNIYSGVKYGVKVNYTAANNWETETNNNKDTADVLSVNTQYYGSLGKNGDVDYYKFSLTSTDTISVRFTHEELTSGYIYNTYWKVYLYNSDWTEQTSFNVTGAQKDVYSDKKALPGGTYYLYVEGHNYSNIKYGISIEGTNQKTVTVTYDTAGGSPANWTEKVTANSAYPVSKTIPAKSFKLTYDANGGSVSPTGKTLSCTFGGWKNGNSIYQGGDSFKLGTSNVTFTAQWTNPTAGSLPTPTHPDDYTFDGWYTAASGGNKVTTSTTISKATTIYAHWIPINKGTITVANVAGRPGTQVKVTVSMKNNPGIRGFDFTVNYDKTRLSLNSVTFDSKFSGLTTPSAGEKVMDRIALVSSDTITANGTVFTLTFNVLSSAKSGKANVSLTANTISDKNNKSIQLNMVAGGVTVQTYIPGDINGDKNVDLLDVIQLLDYVVGKKVTVVEAALDTNGDGNVDLLDVIQLLDYVVGKNVIIK